MFQVKNNVMREKVLSASLLRVEKMPGGIPYPETYFKLIVEKKRKILTIDAGFHRQSSSCFSRYFPDYESEQS